MAVTVPRVEDMVKEGAELFLERFGDYPTIAASAPGRVNLLGDHVDYNDGFVLPMALPLVTAIIGKPNNSPIIGVYTYADVEEGTHLAKFSIPEIKELSPGNPKWANYVKGVIHYFKGKVPGFDAIIVSSVPLGGGLSSSAALEVAMYTFLEILTGCKSSNSNDKALICQKAEHTFANVPCGIMDQMIAVSGRQGHALFLDCRSLVSEHVPIARPDVVILIINSNVCHAFTSSSEYSERKAQCVEAAKILGVKSLRDATMAMLEVRKNEFSKLTFKRAKHVISEINRTAEGVKALKKEDYYSFGHLMNESHTSLRDDFDVSCRKVDELVEISLKCEGVFGSRMTGGGFGGCVITLLRSSYVNELISNIKATYEGEPTFYIAKASSGARNETPILQEYL